MHLSCLSHQLYPVGQTHLFASASHVIPVAHTRFEQSNEHEPDSHFSPDLHSSSEQHASSSIQLSPHDFFPDSHMHDPCLQTLSPEHVIPVQSSSTGPSITGFTISSSPIGVDLSVPSLQAEITNNVSMMIVSAVIGLMLSS